MERMKGKRGGGWSGKNRCEAVVGIGEEKMEKVRGVCRGGILRCVCSNELR